MTKSAMPGDFTLEELLIVRMAREMNGECIAIGATVLSDIAMRVAKTLYAPDLFLVGGSYAAADSIVHPKTYSEEWNAVPTSQLYMEWEDTFDLIRKGRFKVWIGPAQIDRDGNSNMSVIGDWRRPAVQLVGARGLPDNLWGIEKYYFHMVRHTPKHFVERVDFVCSLGYGAERTRLNLKTGFPGTVVSDLGVFGWDDYGQFEIQSLHPGVRFDVVQSRTGFKLKEPPDKNFPSTPPPTPDELECIRTIVDPHGWRRLDAASAPSQLLGELLKTEVERRSTAVADKEG